MEDRLERHTDDNAQRPVYDGRDRHADGAVLLLEDLDADDHAQRADAHAVDGEVDDDADAGDDDAPALAVVRDANDDEDVDRQKDDRRAEQDRTSAEAVEREDAGADSDRAEGEDQDGHDGRQVDAEAGLREDVTREEYHRRRTAQLLHCLQGARNKKHLCCDLCTIYAKQASVPNKFY